MRQLFLPRRRRSPTHCDRQTTIPRPRRGVDRARRIWRSPHRKIVIYVLFEREIHVHVAIQVGVVFRLSRVLSSKLIEWSRKEGRSRHNELEWSAAASGKGLVSRVEVVGMRLSAYPPVVPNGPSHECPRAISSGYDTSSRRSGSIGSVGGHARLRVRGGDALIHGRILVLVLQINSQNESKCLELMSDRRNTHLNHAPRVVDDRILRFDRNSPRQFCSNCCCLRSALLPRLFRQATRAPAKSHRETLRSQPRLHNAALDVERSCFEDAAADRLRATNTDANDA